MTTDVPIRDDSIRLGQFLKLAGLADNGAHARDLVDGVVHRLLRALMHRRFAEQSARDQRYRLGTAPLGLAQAYGTGENLPTLFAPALASISQRSQELVHLGQMDGTRVLYIDRDDFMEVPTKGYFRLVMNDPTWQERYVTELAAAHRMERSMGLSAETLHRGTAGRWMTASKALTVAGAAGPRLPLAGEPDPRAVLDAGRDVHAVLLELAQPALARAGRARLLDHGARAAAAPAGRRSARGAGAPRVPGRRR